MFDAVVAHAARAAGRRQARDRRLLEQGRQASGSPRFSPSTASATTLRVDTWQEVLAAPQSATTFAVLPLETGFEAPDFAVIGEQDILGDRLVRRTRRKTGSDVLTEASSLAVGDLVVHADHGIGRFAGLATIEAAGRAARLPRGASIRAATSSICRSRTSRC